LRDHVPFGDFRLSLGSRFCRWACLGVSGAFSRSF